MSSENNQNPELKNVVFRSHKMDNDLVIIKLNLLYDQVIARQNITFKDRLFLWSLSFYGVMPFIGYLFNKPVPYGYFIAFSSWSLFSCCIYCFLSWWEAKKKIENLTRDIELIELIKVLIFEEKVFNLKKNNSEIILPLNNDCVIDVWKELN